MKVRLLVFLSFIFALLLSGCGKKIEINPENNLSYKIKHVTYNYPYSESPMLFGGLYRSINARLIGGSFYIEANYTATTHNTIEIDFRRTSEQDFYATSEGDIHITMDNYKGPGGDFYILDLRDENGYFKFNHISEDYIEGTFSFRMVRADPNDHRIISPRKYINLKSGKFRINVH